MKAANVRIIHSEGIARWNTDAVEACDFVGRLGARKHVNFAPDVQLYV